MLDFPFSEAIIRSLIRNFFTRYSFNQNRPFDLYIHKGKNLVLLNIDVNYSPAILRLIDFSQY